MVVAVEWNKDVPYYSNIIESLSRDLHCYCVQVKSSDYGDSRIVAPKDSASKDIIKTTGGQNTEIVVFTAVGDGFQVFGVPAVSDADAGDLALLRHIYCLLFLHNGIIRKLIASDSAALFYKTDDPFRVGIYLRDLIQCVLTRL